jgi:hypothetical protein
MSDSITIPQEYQESFRRLFPYMIPSVRSDKEAMESILLYLKVGDEKLARVAIEAMNADHRLSEAALKRKMREESLSREQLEDSEEGDEGDELEDEDLTPEA